MRKFLIILLTILIIALSAGGIYIYSLLNSNNTSLADSPGGKTNLKELGIDEDAPLEKETGVINILLFGVDKRTANEQTRSDSIMIATIDKKNKKLKLTSVMRDMYVPIPGKKDNKINSAYAFGGPTLAMKTVNTNFDLDIKRYATVDFFALERIIEVIGGVDIDVKKSEIKVLNQYLDELNSLDKKGKKSPYVKKSGLQTLNGKQAVAYCRIRYVGRDDFERTERQRRVLSEMFRKVKNINILDVPELASAILPNVETNMSNTEMISLATTVLGFKDKEIYQFRIPTDGAFTSDKIRKMDVLVPDIEKNTKLLHEFIYNSDGPFNPDDYKTDNKDTKNN